MITTTQKNDIMSFQPELIVAEDFGFDFFDVNLGGDTFSTTIDVYFHDYSKTNFQFDINDFCTWLEKTGRIINFIPAELGKSHGKVAFFGSSYAIGFPDETGYQDFDDEKIWIPFTDLNAEGFLTSQNITLFFEDTVDQENSPIEFLDGSEKASLPKQGADFCDFNDFINNYLTK